MTRRVVIEERAARDITEYAHWIAAQGSPLNAVRWVEAIEGAIASLAQMPDRCALAPEAPAFDLPVRQLLFKSHRVLFVLKGRAVHVLHVRHAARLPGDPES